MGCETTNQTEKRTGKGEGTGGVAENRLKDRVCVFCRKRLHETELRHWSVEKKNQLGWG